MLDQERSVELSPVFCGGGDVKDVPKKELNKIMKGHHRTHHMNSIKFTATTKEIEIMGSESFIESNFTMIEDLLAPSLGTMTTKGSKKITTDAKSISRIETIESQAIEAIKIPAEIHAPETVLATQQKGPQEPKVKRPPVRKYFNALGELIRSEDTSAKQNPVVNVIENIPNVISIASIKEKFGLSYEKIEEVIQDAEKLGKVRRDMNGSYVWL